MAVGHLQRVALLNGFLETFHCKCAEAWVETIFNVLQEVRFTGAEVAANPHTVVAVSAVFDCRKHFVEVVDDVVGKDILTNFYCNRLLREVACIYRRIYFAVDVFGIYFF